ncbi:hypothetical protein [Lentiprolixibacter aurantiacus]|uniref:Tail specific protease domain-containing protein n=1 Tax=Lentiprolixibacter aurantiacus TaxID=2993939 RepID=A0AAE3MI52_9FLAO|nr:hypothetical protein [Lentiprolixibacter aurantiacus]MCX2718100.1 hypothetical protein [Lentiprolixibacter aurantiacus]
MKFRILILIICISLSNAVVSQVDTTISREQWIEDLEFLENTLNKKHKNVNHRISKEELASKFSALKSNLDDLNSRQKLIEIIKLTSSIGDGHTSIRSFDIFNYLPIHVKWFGKDLRVIYAKNSLSDIVGFKIVAMGKYKVSEVQERINVMTPQAENRYMLIQWGQQWMRNADVLKHLGISDSNSGIDLLLENTEGALVKKHIPAMITDALKKEKWIGVYEPQPLYMQNPGFALSSVILDDALYLNFRSYPSKKEIKSLSDELINTLSNQKNLSKLIVDFRVNGGGDFNIGRFLIEKLKKSSSLDNAKVYVITGRRTYSAAMVNALDFKKELGALIIGEPPMQRPNGYSESYPFTLPNSRIKATVSIENYTFQEGDTDEVILDKYFIPNYDLLKSGRDEILEWISLQ